MVEGRYGHSCRLSERAWRRYRRNGHGNHSLIVNGGSVPDVMETLLPMFESATGNKVKISLKAGPAILDWAEGFFAAMQPFNAGEVYVNSLDQGEVHRVREAYRIKLRPVGSTQSEIRPDQFLSLQSKYPSPIAAENGRQPERWRMVQGIDNIGICTTDLTRSVAFYEKSWASRRRIGTTVV